MRVTGWTAGCCLPRRFAYGAQGGSPEDVQALRDVVVATIVEKPSAVEHLEEILSVPGVDMVQWGPSDYYVSSGRLGGRNPPQVQAVGRSHRNRAREWGTAARRA